VHCSTEFGKKHSPLLSAALQTRQTAALCHCNYTYGHCSPYRLAPNTNALQHWIWQEAFPSAQCCSTNQADSSLEPLQIHLWTLALHTGLQSPNTSVLQHRIWQEAFPTAECCSANQTDSSLVPLQIHLWPFSPHTGLQSPTRMQCRTRSGKNHSLLLSAALQTRLPAALCHCRYTYIHLLYIQVSSDPTPMHCSTGFGNKHSPLVSAALQTRLTTALSHCKYTYGP